MALIYVVDDDEDVRRVVEVGLAADGHETESFSCGEDMLRRLASRPCDLVVLDVMLPGEDGFSVLRSLRTMCSVPVIMLTAKSEESDFCQGVLSGADDYVSKPFRPIILRGKVHALLRRVAIDRSGVCNCLPRRLKCGNVIACEGGKIFLIDGGGDLPLTPVEGKYLYYLMERYKRPVSRGDALRDVWGLEEGSSRVVDETNRRLRNKLIKNGASISPQGIWGFGYVLKEW